MACVAQTLAFASLLALAAAPLSSAVAQQADGKAEQAQPKTKKSAKKGEAAKAAGEDTKKAAADPAAIGKSLDAAQKALDANKADQAVGQINTLIGNGGLDARSMARALALRGHAYRKQGKPAQAISDLQSAIWLKDGLNDAERAAALQARIEAYREAGLGEAPPIAGKGAQSRQAAAPSGAPQANAITTSGVPARPEPQRPASGSGGGFFSSLFGGSSPKPTPVEPAPAKAPSEPALSSWTASSNPQPAAKAAPPAVTTNPAQTASVATGKASPAPAAPAAAGGFKIQLAAVKSREEARATAERARREYGSQLGTRPYEIDETRFGNATFYRARFGAFASIQEAKALCASLRNNGVDCLASE